MLLVLYTVIEANKPKPVDWSVTLSKNDKIPYGGFVFFQQLQDLFPNVAIHTCSTPLYEQINNSYKKNTAYLLISSTFAPSQSDVVEMKNYVEKGNYIFASADQFQRAFLNAFKLETGTRFSLLTKDSTSINFVNPALRSSKDYTFYRATIDAYFTKTDTAKSIILGANNHRQPDFIKVPYGKGAFFIHSNPVCFSNYFLLHGNNASYASKALSYIPANVTEVFWDEYYKARRQGASTPFRFLLSNEYLRWAFRLALIGLLLYVLFEMKRRQRIIPVIKPLRNSTLDFIKTISALYFNEGNNNDIANKKVTYFLEFVRTRFNLSTHEMGEPFIEQLSRKSGVEKEYVAGLINMLTKLPWQNVSDRLLVVLNNKIDNFYKQV